MPPLTKQRNLRPSPRHIVLRRRRQRLGLYVDDSPLKPGYQRIHSFAIPGLRAGTYEIDADQVITANDNPNKTVSNKQIFTAIGPRYSLPADAVYSTYPPQSHEDRPEVLPHVVLNDPTLPWTRVGSWASEAQKLSIKDYDGTRVPWLAVIAFKAEELVLPKETLDAIWKQLPQGTPELKQSATAAVNMKIKDLAAIAKVDASGFVSPITKIYNPTVDGEDVRGDIIFVKPDLFNGLFSEYASDGTTTPTQGNVQRYRFLAHTCELNMKNMADADTDFPVAEVGIVVSHRTGPLTIEKPEAMVVHLVSLEGIEEMKSPEFPVQANKLVAMTSLYSWQYTCLPLNSFSIVDAFEKLAGSTAMMKPLDTDKIPTTDGLEKRMVERLNDGYSLVRYRVQTGEETVAFTRGPLIPTKATTTNLIKESMSGQDLQILDRGFGIMDLSYSSAWQLGRTLALADQSFATALSRVRKQIYDRGLNECQSQLLARAGLPHKTKSGVLQSISDAFEALLSLSNDNDRHTFVTGRSRWTRDINPDFNLNLAYSSNDMEASIESALYSAACYVSGSDDTLEPYDELNDPNSSDWMILLRWVLDRIYLAEVPGHFLITDPAHLPIESIRCFNIDQNWINALIDGSLSLANHTDLKEDKVRNVMKRCINKYFETTKTEVPVYGFLIRSQILVKFPDIIVETYLNGKPTTETILIRHTILDTGIMLGLCSAVPDGKSWDSLRLTQPPHQQFFTAAKEISDDSIKLLYKKIYTVLDPTDPKRGESLEAETWHRDSSKDSPDLQQRGRMFLWSSKVSDPNDKSDDLRFLNVETLAKDLNTQLKKHMNDEKNTWYGEGHPTSATIAIQLNDPCWRLEILLDPASLSQNDAIDDSKSTPPPVFSLSCRVPTPKPISALPKRRTNVISAEGQSLTRTRRLPTTDCPPPHHQVLQFIEKLPPLFLPFPLPKGYIFTEPAHKPYYDYKIYPVTTLTSKKPPTSYIPYNQDIKKRDLIFSVVYKSGAHSFLLQRLTFHIRFEPDEYDNPILMTSYNGIGAVMLSNLRLNVRVQYTTAEANKLELVISLIPRSTRQWVEVSKLKELSFMLKGVEVANTKKTRTVTLSINEEYVSGNYDDEVKVEVQGSEEKTIDVEAASAARGSSELFSPWSDSGFMSPTSPSGGDDDPEWDKVERSWHYD
ncbi:hypothetical protein TWF679_010976 [Orbilia oligospora]|uniref:Uncharacterized protein n=1 Tax=Orbilia oligospora TaxID=2813651 RepID=A0A8H8VIM2_ORBOL|nr:hypothetical protein TWF679_010976 [Orbilia oligospora]